MNAYNEPGIVWMMYGNCPHFMDKGLTLTEVKPFKITATQWWSEFEFTCARIQSQSSFHNIHIQVIMEYSLAQGCKYHSPQVKFNKMYEIQ